MRGAVSPELSFVTSRLGAYRLALPLDQVSCIASWDELLPVEESFLEMGALLGEPRPARGRRLAGLSGAGGELFVLLGEAIGVRHVELRSVYPLPGLLVQAGARFGCAGLVHDEDGFTFLLDAERLRALARRS